MAGIDERRSSVGKISFAPKGKRWVIEGSLGGGELGVSINGLGINPLQATTFDMDTIWFNEKIGEIQRVAKEAFGRLKGRWRCLLTRTDVKLSDLAVVVGACCILHKICEMKGDGFDPDLKSEFFDDYDDDEMVPDVDLRSMSSMEARDAIAHNLLHHAI